MVSGGGHGQDVPEEGRDHAGGDGRGRADGRTGVDLDQPGSESLEKQFHFLHFGILFFYSFNYFHREHRGLGV